jgi:hypothetical protein
MITWAHIGDGTCYELPIRSSCCRLQADSWGHVTTAAHGLSLLEPTAYSHACERLGSFRPAKPALTPAKGAAWCKSRSGPLGDCTCRVMSWADPEAL